MREIEIKARISNRKDIVTKLKTLGLDLGEHLLGHARIVLERHGADRLALGPGSDGYHENHIHVDLAERAGGHRMCQWDVREPGEEAVPLPQPRPTAAP